ncbi:5-oxoprolinase subunit PxpB [Emticicia sp. 21SJ11W-3]|uniref:5-oxoprolinase subunit PxpB n=1 Tax=Emticicia sp. 21SJ11W-3 TaxID=2916755 RepID=UPI0020A19157|nr:5-oxoprolinase subunit PxpB [Emticicia sp. 21SJ11W-3]UTA66415.1 5-oxoprolinase subunit PxpB [Emticicia sp. 21SJ11W-3]
MKHRYKIFPLSDSAVTIDFGSVIDEAVNTLVSQLFHYCNSQPFIGFQEAVPAYASLTIFYDVVQVRIAYPETPTAYALAENYLKEALNKTISTANISPNRIDIPVIYDGEDLAHVAAHNGLSKEEVIEIHSAATYRVYMMGFLPGFAYLGGMDTRIATPRRASPRTKVPAGSVGIAGQQTGIYPLASPGGWQLIGHTDALLFNISSESPTLLKAGDLVKFVRVE